MPKRSYEKYSGITNHYDNKFVNMFLNSDVDVEEMTFQITEKIDGSNFQIYITKDSVRYGKRSNWLGDDENFFDWQRIVEQDKVQRLIKAFQSDMGGYEEVSIYGEIFGTGIQKRIKYFDKKDIRFFEMKGDGVWCTPKEMEDTFCKLRCGELHVPVVGYVKGLSNAIEFDTEIPTRLSDETVPQNMEGIVIKPMYEVVYTRNDCRLIVKKKSVSFCEIAKVKIKEPKKANGTTNIQKVFLEYINESRLCSVISKHGELESQRDIGKFIGLLKEDAWEEFSKMHPELINDKKHIVSVTGSVAAPLVKKYLTQD